MTLTIDDFITPMFDRQKPKKRRVNARPEIEHLLEEDDSEYYAAEEAFMMNPDDPDAEETFMTAGAEGFNQKKEQVIEGVTFTDGYNQIGYTYHLIDGMLYLNYLDKKKSKNVRLIEKPISTIDEFEKYIKQADKKISKYR